jgi:hypothetical protein
VENELGHTGIESPSCWSRERKIIALSALPPANLTLGVYEKESHSLIFNEYSLNTVIAGLIKEETSQLNSRARMGGFDRSA